VTALWDENRGTIRTRAGGWKINGGVSVYGYQLFEELMGRRTWFEVMMLSATGRMPEPRVAAFGELIWLCLSYPDPRIWCNQVSALAATMRCGPTTAVSAASLCCDSLRYGAWAAQVASEFLAGALPAHAAGRTVASLIEGCTRDAAGTPQVPGFGRPVVRGDDRVPVLHRIATETGLAAGPHLALALALDRELRATWNEEINAGGLGNAVLLDCGFSVDEIVRLWAMGLQAGAMACFTDAAAREPESFLPLRCDDVDYRGVASRTLTARTRTRRDP
jgi:hypothetical protein